MTEKKRYRVDILNNIMDTNYDWFGHTPPFDQYVIDEEDYLVIGEAKTQGDGEKICKLLNSFAEENEVLKSELDDKRLGMQLFGAENTMLMEENKQLQKQIKVYEYFLEQNNLDIDWNCLCTADECHIQEDIDFDCKDCKYMELIE